MESVCPTRRGHETVALLARSAKIVALVTQYPGRDVRIFQNLVTTLNLEMQLTW